MYHLIVASTWLISNIFYIYFNPSLTIMLHRAWKNIIIMIIIFNKIHKKYLKDCDNPGQNWSPAIGNMISLDYTISLKMIQEDLFISCSKQGLFVSQLFFVLRAIDTFYQRYWYEGTHWVALCWTLNKTWVHRCLTPTKSFMLWLKASWTQIVSLSVSLPIFKINKVAACAFVECI